MVSFSCENCGDVLTKKKLDQHRNQCRGASYTCLDCMLHFNGTEYRAHTSCISEAQKYQGHLFRDKDKQARGHQARIRPDSQAMIARPLSAYVEDAPDLGDEGQAIAVIDVPPKAPSPPPAAEALPENINVFDFLVNDETPNRSRIELGAPDETKMIEHSQDYANGDSQYSQYSNGNGSRFLERGFSYGNAPVEPSFQRYDSWQSLNDAAQSHAYTNMPPPPYVTPAHKSKHDRKESKVDKRRSETSDKKRKRHDVEDLDLSLAKRPTSRDQMKLDIPANSGSGGKVLHSGLSGGLSRLLTRHDDLFSSDRADTGASPLSPMKRSKRERERSEPQRKVSNGASRTSSSRHDREERHRTRAYHDDKESRRHHRHRDSSSSDDRYRSSQREAKRIEYRPTSTEPSAATQIITYRSHAELFLSYIQKGPDSERGCSINKALKRYHRERAVRGEDREEEDKGLWKSLRVRRNERGEYVLFV